MDFTCQGFRNVTKHGRFQRVQTQRQSNRTSSPTKTVFLTYYIIFVFVDLSDPGSSNYITDKR
jgi:hypothetical protein